MRRNTQYFQSKATGEIVQMTRVPSGFLHQGKVLAIADLARGWIAISQHQRLAIKEKNCER